MDIFSGIRQSLNFDGATLKVDKKGRKTAKLKLSCLITRENEDLLPAYIHQNVITVRAPENELLEASIGKAVPSQNVRFFSVPNAKRATYQLEHVQLGELELKRPPAIAEAVTLHFTIIHDLTPGFTAWIGDVLGSELWASFEAAQGEMFDETHVEEPRAEAEPVAAGNGKKKRSVH